MDLPHFVHRFMIVTAAVCFGCQPVSEPPTVGNAGEAATGQTLAAEITLDLGDDFTLPFVLIPAGEFLMGSPPDEPGRDSDEHLHRVRIRRPFYLGKFEVTQSQWEAVMGEGPSFFHGEAALPVESVRDEQCIEFCRRLSRLARRRVRLPSEAEWEYAARAGTAGAFSCGDELVPHDANFDWSQGGAADVEPSQRTLPVGSFPANPWGLHDMHGNVREWCADWYARDSYQTAPAVDPTGPRQGSQRVLRGGSWDDLPARCRSAYRHGFRPGDREESNGLRVCVEVP